eukprot:1190786-Prorocentrum_minimum.AAC.1
MALLLLRGGAALFLGERSNGEGGALTRSNSEGQWGGRVAGRGGLFLCVRAHFERDFDRAEAPLPAVIFGAVPPPILPCRGRDALTVGWGRCGALTVGPGWCGALTVGLGWCVTLTVGPGWCGALTVGLGRCGALAVGLGQHGALTVGSGRLCRGLIVIPVADGGCGIGRRRRRCQNITDERNGLKHDRRDPYGRLLTNTCSGGASVQVSDWRTFPNSCDSSTRCKKMLEGSIHLGFKHLLRSERDIPRQPWPKLR